MLGALAGGFLLLPLLGMEKSFFILVIAYGLAGWCIPGTGSKQPIVVWTTRGMATALIVLVVVFQPELRVALAQIGHSRMFRFFFKLEEREAADEIVRAAARLAELGYGGLIVIERNVGGRLSADALKMDLNSSQLMLEGNVKGEFRE